MWFFFVQCDTLYRRKAYRCLIQFSGIKGVPQVSMFVLQILQVCGNIFFYLVNFFCSYFRENIEISIDQVDIVWVVMMKPIFCCILLLLQQYFFLVLFFSTFLYFWLRNSNQQTTNVFVTSLDFSSGFGLPWRLC